MLRKRQEGEMVFLDQVIHDVEREVKEQLNSMTQLDDASDPNFGDSDYQLAAYAAALRVITSNTIDKDEIDPIRAIYDDTDDSATQKVEELILNAVAVACEHLSPQGITKTHWRGLMDTERFYLKGLEMESRGERRSGVYQELARGFGAKDYKELLESDKANQTRLKTASEFSSRNLANEASRFSNSLTRHLLYALHIANKQDETRAGLNYLRTELPGYWTERERAIHLLEFFARFGGVESMNEWRKDAEQARLLAGALRNDNI